MSSGGWTLRTVPLELTRRYRAEGFWTDDTLGHVLDGSLRARPELPFRIWSDVHPFSGTVGDVHHLARRVAGGLAARGVKAGDVVAFQLPNWIEAAAVFWGVSLLGAIVVPIVHIYGAREVGYILRESGARAHVTADRFGSLDYLGALAEVRPALPDLELVVTVGETSGGHSPFGELVAEAPLRRPSDVDPDGPAVIGYTSGTTANPKGVIHSHRTLLAEVRQLTAPAPGQLRGTDDERATLMGSPVSHATGMLGGLLSPVVAGRPIHLIDRWDPAAALVAIVEGDLSCGGGATYFLTSLLDAPDFGPEHLARIRHVGLGGAPIPAAVADRAHALGISLVRAYGSTEHPSVTGCAHGDPVDKRLHTDGRAMPGVEIRVVDDSGRPVAPGRAGPIWSRGPELFVGYTDPALTRAAVDGEGWYATGDVGVLDGEGYLTITDRTADIIIRGGENISAAEVEELVACMPGVAEVAVVAAPDPRFGERVCAFVRPAPVTGPAEPTPDLATVRAHLGAAGLARQKWPEEIRLVEDFPRTPSGKVKKFVLRQQVRSGR